MRSKGCLSYETVKIMAFKMIQAAQKTWCKLNGQNQLPKVMKGVEFTDAIETARDNAAACADAVTKIHAQLADHASTALVERPNRLESLTLAAMSPHRGYEPGSR